MITKTIPWERIERLLDARRRDVAWLRKELGVHSNNVTNWKQRGVPKARASALARILQTTTDYLLEGEQQPVVAQTAPTQAPTPGPELLGQVSELLKMWADLQQSERGLVLDFIATILRRRGIDSRNDLAGNQS